MFQLLLSHLHSVKHGFLDRHRTTHVEQKHPWMSHPWLTFLTTDYDVNHFSVTVLYNV